VSLTRWVHRAAAAADDKLGSDTLIIDVGDVLSITDFFVITSAPNARQVRAIAEEVEVQLKQDGGPVPIRIEGKDDLEWILLDYGPFVVHVFHDEVRAYYDLERLWGDCPRVEWQAG